MSGTRWTRGRLERTLRVAVGRRGDRDVDTAAVAAAMGVSRRTVQRWLQGSSARATAKLPAARLEQLQALIGPSEQLQGRERGDAVYAVDAIAALERPRGIGVKPIWKQEGWLEQHLMAVVEIRLDGGDRARQLVVLRNGGQALQQLRRRGKIVDQGTVPTKFHATLVSYRVLTQRRPWRFRAQPGQVKRGFTQTWLAQAPATHLGREADEVTRDPAAYLAATESLRTGGQ